MMEEPKEKKRSLLRRLPGICLWLVAGLLVVLLIYVIICNFRGKVAFVGDYAVVRIISPSMEPTIPTGGYILVKKTTAEEVKIGDVLLFRSEDPDLAGQMNTHRVVAIREDGSFTTKGDNNASEDVFGVPTANVVAVYQKNLSFVTKAVKFCSSWIGYVLLILVPVALFIGFGIRDLKSKKN